MKKLVYPPADPAHLCDCECHEPDASMIHCMPCCSGCECGANIQDLYWGQHKKTCKPTKNRHKDQTP